MSASSEGQWSDRRGAEGGETEEIPHPRDLGWDRVGKRVGNFPTLFWAQRALKHGKKIQAYLENFCYFLVITNTFKNDSFKNIRIVSFIILF